MLLEISAGHSFETKKWGNIVKLFKADSEERVLEMETFLALCLPYTSSIILFIKTTGVSFMVLSCKLINITVCFLRRDSSMIL